MDIHQLSADAVRRLLARCQSRTCQIIPHGGQGLVRSQSGRLVAPCDCVKLGARRARSSAADEKAKDRQQPDRLRRTRAEARPGPFGARSLSRRLPVCRPAKRSVRPPLRASGGPGSRRRRCWAHRAGATKPFRTVRAPPRTVCGWALRPACCCVDVKGYCVDVKGYNVDVKGCFVDVKGYCAAVCRATSACGIASLGTW